MTKRHKTAQEEFTDSLESHVEREPIPQEDVAPVQEQTVNEKSADGWHSIETAPQDGTNILISETGADEGAPAYWMLTRKFKNGIWAPRGRWTDPLTHKELSLKAAFWKET
jgi:hypothetical protein